MDLSGFESQSGISFRNKALLEQAFTHRSFLNENPRAGAEHNERLEFLGDAVLELVVTDYLYKTYPGKDEGELTAYRAALVNAVTVGAVGAEMQMNDFMRLSKGEAKDTGRARQVILANAYEAFVGALYLDQGYEAAAKCITKTLIPKLTEVLEENLWRDAKSFFQEKVQDVYGVTPVYKVLEETGPDHNKQFVAGAYVGTELISKGKGHSKQEAEQHAAREGLKAKGWK